MAEESKEVKPSFSFRYIVLTLVTTGLVSGIGLGITKLLESRPVRILEVFQDEAIDVLNEQAFPRDQIEATYRLKDNPKKKIATLFRKLVAIKNAGNEGVENIVVAAALEQSNAQLVSAPKIRTRPREIVDAVAISRIDGATTTRQSWNISLLNPGESVVFEYFVYSEIKLPNVTLIVVPRKKDWQVVNKSFLADSLRPESIALRIFLATLGAVIGLLGVILGGAIPIYRFQWNRRADFRAQYKTFWNFYNRHRPWNLFDPESKEPDNRGNAS
jgi:hypothetical protein